MSNQPTSQSGPQIQAPIVPTSGDSIAEPGGQRGGRGGVGHPGLLET